MNIGLFGGTFDPIHSGHIALACAARERCELRRIYFVPANIPPHKERPPVASYFDRYAMVALATREENAFLPSLLEAPGAIAAPPRGKGKHSDQAVAGANYTIDTIRRLKQTLKKRDRGPVAEFCGPGSGGSHQKDAPQPPIGVQISFILATSRVGLTMAASLIL